MAPKYKNDGSARRIILGLLKKRFWDLLGSLTSKRFFLYGSPHKDERNIREALRGATRRDAPCYKLHIFRKSLHLVPEAPV